MSRLDDIQARLDAATPGPWPDDYVSRAVRHVARNCDYIESDTDPDFGWDRYDDAPLIAHAPQDLADLLAVARAARNLDAAWAADLVEYRAAQDALRDALSRLEDGDPS